MYLDISLGLQFVYFVYKTENEWNSVFELFGVSDDTKLYFGGFLRSESLHAASID